MLALPPALYARTGPSPNSGAAASRSTPPLGGLRQSARGGDSRTCPETRSLASPRATHLADAEIGRIHRHLDTRVPGAFAGHPQHQHCREFAADYDAIRGHGQLSRPSGACIPLPFSDDGGRSGGGDHPLAAHSKRGGGPVRTDTTTTSRRPATAVLRFVTAGRRMEVWLVHVERHVGPTSPLARRIVAATYGDVIDVSAAEVLAARRRVVADADAGRVTPEWIRLVAVL